MEPIPLEEAFEVIQSQYVAHLGVVVDGTPYVTPMSYVVEGNRILFRTLEGKKLNAIQSNPSVCVEVSRFDEETGDWVSVIVTGTASEVSDDNTKANTTALLFRKYGDILGSPLSHGPGMRPLEGFPHVVEVVIEEIHGLSSGRGWSVRTRPGRL